MKTKNIILGAVLALVGLLMIIMPLACIKAVVVLVGLAAIATGIYSLVVYYKAFEDASIKKVILIRSILSIVIGLVAVVCPIVLAKTASIIWKVFSFILAFYLLCYASSGFVSLSMHKEALAEDKKRIIYESLICILIAALLCIIPLKSIGEVFVRVIGVGALFIGAVLIAVEIIVSKRTTVVEDAVVVDDPDGGNTTEGETEEKAGESDAAKAEENAEAAGEAPETEEAAAGAEEAPAEDKAADKE